MNRAVAFVACAGTAVSVACGPTKQGECFDCSATVLALSPVDLATGDGGVTLRVTVSGSSVTGATLDAIVAGARLRTYPELSDVPFTAVPHLVTPASTRTESYVEIIPDAPLDTGRFYVVSVDGLGSVVSAPAHPVFRAEPGAHVARFGTGALPIVRKVSMDENGVVSVELSESLVIAEATIASQVRVADGSLAACNYLPPGIPNSPAVRSASVITYRCAPTAYAGQKLHLEFGAPLLTPSGIPLRWMDPRSTTTSGLLVLPGPTDVVLSPDGRGRASWSP